MRHTSKIDNINDINNVGRRGVMGKSKNTTIVLILMLIFFGYASVNAAPPPVSEEEFEIAKGIFFNRCAGCHGTLRKGATGPNLTKEKFKEKGYDTATIKAFITNGTPGGMPTWGEYLKPEEIDILARFLQHDAPLPPEMSISQMKESWNLIVPVAKRPKRPQHKRNWQNFFGIVLRDAGQVAIVDGDTKELLSVIDTGFAVHILRTSASGRYIYSIGRDGKATMIDLWMKKPAKVAEVKTCTEARSIDSSKYKGYEDKLAVVGCYWPPHIAIIDGQTLEPKKLVSSRSYTYDTYEYHPEPRVAAIISSHAAPEWILNIKETGYIWFVDYTDLDNLKLTQVEAERFLHDGGWDASKRYVMMAANMRDTVAVVDSKTKELVAKIKTGIKPHPGRGANWTDPKYGPVSATPHLGEPSITVWGSDPKGHAKNAWKVVRKIKTLGGGSLFIKTHPKSKHVWFDHPLNPDVATRQSVCVYDRTNPDADSKCWRVADHGRVVHFEYNQAGDEVWISVWDKKGEILIYDDKTLKLKKAIKGDWMVTPTGHFNVYNTMKDLY